MSGSDWHPLTTFFVVGTECSMDTVDSRAPKESPADLGQLSLGPHKSVRNTGFGLRQPVRQ